MRSFQKNTTFCVLLRSLAKEHCILCFLLRSLQKNVAIFHVLCKRTLHSLRFFTFLRKEHKRTHCSFWSHKSPKTRKKNVKERCVLLKNDAFRMQKNAVPNPGFTLYSFEQQSKWGGDYTLQFCTTKHIGGFTPYNIEQQSKGGIYSLQFILT